MGLLSKALVQDGADVINKITPIEDKNDGSPLDRITRYHQANTLFYGIVFEAPPVKNKKKKNNRLFEDISGMLGTLSTVIALPSSRVLALFPHSLDMAVIIHRISKSLGAEVVDDFEASNPDAAFEKIQDYL
jgi:hypothetical protein